MGSIVMTRQLKFISGDIFIDDRGELKFCNDFEMTDVKRFYQVSNHKTNFIRAWHAHKEESKYVYVVTGALILGAVKIDNWDNPSKTSTVERFVLSEKKPGVLFIPGGYAHGYKTLVTDTRIMFFSTASIAESAKDDYRYKANYWNPWEVVER